MNTVTSPSLDNLARHSPPSTVAQARPTARSKSRQTRLMFARVLCSSSAAFASDRSLQVMLKTSSCRQVISGNPAADNSPFAMLAPTSGSCGG
jgi:hypothetical protein